MAASAKRYRIEDSFRPDLLAESSTVHPVNDEQIDQIWTYIRSISDR